MGRVEALTKNGRERRRVAFPREVNIAVNSLIVQGVKSPSTADIQVEVAETRKMAGESRFLSPSAWSVRKTAEVLVAEGKLRNSYTGKSGENSWIPAISSPARRVSARATR